MSRRGELDAIVVGGGAIGAALALALARDDFEVALVEARAPKPWRAEDDVDLRVVALAADARKLFEALGVWPAIANARIGPYQRMHVYDGTAPGELTFDAADDGNAALGWIIENRLIQHALWQAVEVERNARVVCPGEVASIVNKSDGVEAVLADGTRLRARVAIAADGAQSPVRAMLGIEANGRDYAQRGLVANVTTARPHEHTAWQRFLPTGPLAFLPLADGRCSIVWTLPDAEAARILALADDAFRAELGAAFDFRLGEIVATSARAAFPLQMRLATRYVSGRVVLAGDAAHVVHPLAGQGMNLGFRDVACLSRVLRDAHKRGGDIGAAHVLRHYERERRSENALAARGLDAIERVFTANDPLTPAVRGAALSLADRLAPLKGLLASMAAGRA
jgi:2-octaprenyl-3-methyl-6-methoxy-1,4-benzoquinol hydroxylase/2-octaprenylphenol hydroxylase